VVLNFAMLLVSDGTGSESPTTVRKRLGWSKNTRLKTGSVIEHLKGLALHVLSIAHQHSSTTF
jgi:hypothetical protein